MIGNQYKSARFLAVSLMVNLEPVKSPSDTHILHGAGICINIYPKNHPNVGKYTIYGASGSADFGAHQKNLESPKSQFWVFSIILLVVTSPFC